MLIDRSQRSWISATIILAAGCTVAYAFDPQAQTIGHGGSTLVGLTLGLGAYAIMLFCAALALKRRVPHWKLGAARSWMRGHVWLGLLSVLMVGLHSAFALGGPLTTVLWALLAFVTVSALLGIVLQQLVPRLLLHSLQQESVAQQIDRLLLDTDERLRKAVIAYAGSLDTTAPGWSATSASAGGAAAAASAPAVTIAHSQGTAPKADLAPDVTIEITRERAIDINKPPFGGEPLRKFYVQYILPYIEGAPASLLRNPGRAESLFTALRTMTPPHIHAGIDEVRELVTHRRQLLRQRALMRVLFGWLLVHVPLSWALLVLAGVHAVIALRFLQWPPS